MVPILICKTKRSLIRIEETREKYLAGEDSCVVFSWLQRKFFA